jgi:tetratricopeptide (TPR) repeat protein
VAASPQEAAARRLVERAKGELAAGRAAAASDLLERAVAVDPTCAEGYYQLARVHADRDDHEAALGFLDKAEQVAARDPAALGEILSLRGTVLEELGRPDEARAAYERALHWAPGSVRARVGLGRVNGRGAGGE